MIRTTKKPSTAKYNLGLYMGMLISEPISPTCTTLANTINIRHDSVNRFLERETYEPKDLYDHEDGKTKNDYFLDMLTEVLKKGEWKQVQDAFWVYTFGALAY